MINIEYREGGGRWGENTADNAAIEKDNAGKQEKISGEEGEENACCKFEKGA